MRSMRLGVLLLALSSVAFPAPAVETQYGTYCGLWIRGETSSRHVYGPVSAECNGCFLQHTGPFGNWGVASWFGPPNDGVQYKGWAITDHICQTFNNTPEWNSCTGSFPPPNSQTYNHPFGEYTSQFSPTNEPLGTVFDWFQTSEEEGCTILDGAEYIGGATMSIYELDWPDSDEQVTTLQSGISPVTLSCQRDGCAFAAGPWVNSSNIVTSADFRMVVVGSCLNIDGKGGC